MTIVCHFIFSHYFVSQVTRESDEDHFVEWVGVGCWTGNIRYLWSREWCINAPFECDSLYFGQSWSIGTRRNTGRGSHPTGVISLGKVGPNGEVEQDSWVPKSKDRWKGKDATNKNLPQHVAQLNRSFGIKNLKTPPKKCSLKVWPLTQTPTICLRK